MPRVGVDQVAAGAGRVRLEATGAEALSGYRHNASYADFSVMPTMSCEDAAGLAGIAGMSA